MLLLCTRMLCTGLGALLLQTCAGDIRMSPHEDGIPARQWVALFQACKELLQKRPRGAPVLLLQLGAPPATGIRQLLGGDGDGLVTVVSVLLEHTLHTRLVSASARDFAIRVAPTELWAEHVVAALKRFDLGMPAIIVDGADGACIDTACSGTAAAERWQRMHDMGLTAGAATVILCQSGTKMLDLVRQNLEAVGEWRLVPLEANLDHGSKPYAVITQPRARNQQTVQGGEGGLEVAPCPGCVWPFLPREWYLHRRGTLLGSLTTDGDVQFNEFSLSTNRPWRGHGINTRQMRPAVAPVELEAERSRCLKQAVATDLSPALQRSRSAGVSGTCRESLIDEYCEAVLDYTFPIPLANGCTMHDDSIHGMKGSVTQLLAPRRSSLAFVVMLTTEVHSAARLVSRLFAPENIFTLHIEPNALAGSPHLRRELESLVQPWGARVRIHSLLPQRRGGSSQMWAALKLLEAVADDAITLGIKPDFVIMLSISHYPLVLVEEMSEFLWLRQLNFVAVDTHWDQSQVFGFECPEWFCEALRDGEEHACKEDCARVIMPMPPHPNQTIATGTWFPILRWDFVEWLNHERHQIGSAAWTLIRYTARLANPIEMIFQTLLLSTKWCYETVFLPGGLTVSGAMSRPYALNDSEIMYTSPAHIEEDADFSFARSRELLRQRVNPAFFIRKLGTSPASDAFRNRLDEDLGNGSRLIRSHWPFAATVLYARGGCGPGSADSWQIHDARISVQLRPQQLLLTCQGGGSGSPRLVATERVGVPATRRERLVMVRLGVVWNAHDMHFTGPVGLVPLHPVGLAAVLCLQARSTWERAASAWLRVHIVSPSGLHFFADNLIDASSAGVSRDTDWSHYATAVEVVAVNLPWKKISEVGQWRLVVESVEGPGRDASRASPLSPLTSSMLWLDRSFWVYDPGEAASSVPVGLIEEYFELEEASSIAPP